MKIEPEDDGHRPLERNVHGQDGQGSWVISLCAAAAIACGIAKDPYVFPAPDEIISLFTSAAQPKKKPSCEMMALSRSPPVGCSYDKK